jgi:hypothetical protein
MEKIERMDELYEKVKKLNKIQKGEEISTIIYELHRKQELDIFKTMLNYIESTGKFMIVDRKQTIKGTNISWDQSVRFLTADECISSGLEPIHQIIERPAEYVKN